MKFGVIEFKELGESGLKFECIGGWDEFNILTNVIEKEIKAEKIGSIDGVWNRSCWYKKKSLLFKLHHNDDIGNYVEIANVEHLKSLYFIKNNKKAIDLIGNDYLEDNTKSNQLLYEIALQITDILNEKIVPPSKSYEIDDYITLEQRDKATIILIDQKCTELHLLEDDKRSFETLCSDIEKWVNSDFTLSLLPDYLEWQILKKLIVVDAPKSRLAFKQHIAMRYRDADSSYRKFLKENGYLEDFTKEELDELKKQ